VTAEEEILSKWAKDWFNLLICEHLNITNKHTPVLSDYHIEGYTINKVSSLSWSKHTSNIVNKAHSVWGFLQTNIRQYSVLVKVKAYFAFVRPIVEYTSVIWSPFTSCNKTALEGVQCKLKLPDLYVMVKKFKERDRGIQSRLIMFLNYSWSSVS